MTTLSFPEAERAMLHILLMPDAPVGGLMGRLSAEDFFENMHQMLFGYIQETFNQTGRVEVLSLIEMIQSRQPKGLTAYDVTMLMSECVTMSASQVQSLLQQYRWRRQAMERAVRLVNQLKDLTTSTESILNQAAVDLSNITLDRQLDCTTLAEAVHTVLGQYADNQDPARRHQCVKSGFSRIDQSGGLPPVGVTVVAADTGQGKSSLAVDLAMENVRQGDKVAFYNLEMPTEDVARRIVSANTGIPFHELAYGVPTEVQLEQVRTATRVIADTGGDRFFFDSHSPDGMEDIISSIRRLADPRGAGVSHFYVDYLQILSWSGNPRTMRWQNIEQMLAEAARRFHNLCLQLNIQIVLTSQVNRDLSHGELTLDRIRDSKQIADAATCVLLLYRPEAYGEGYKSREFQSVDPRGTALITIGKRRNGPCLKFVVGFDSQRTTFYDLDRLPMAEPSQLSVLGAFGPINR